MESGRLLTRNISRALPNKVSAASAEVILLMLLGALAMLLHAKLRIPMHLPGKQGLWFMAFIAASGMMSQFSFARSLACLGAASMLFLPLGFDDPFMAPVYIVMGVIMDLLFGLFSRFTSSVFILAFAGAIGWASIPLLRSVAEAVTGYHYISMAGGVLWPLATHLIFGFTGSLIGAGIVKLTDKKN